MERRKLLFPEKFGVLLLMGKKVILYVLMDGDLRKGMEMEGQRDRDR